jgi:cytochrome c biogenesis protein CcmG, thiol:disulfide interchange protein DsbE
MAKANRLKYRSVAIVIAVAALIAQLFVIIRSPTTDRPSEVDAGQIPQFSLPHLENPKATLTDRDLAHGQLVVLNFFASWCGPCEIEHPLLMRIADTAPVVGIDHMDSPTKAARYLARLGNPYKVVGVDADGKTLGSFGFDSIPTTVVLSGAGNVLYLHRGRLKDEDVDEIILPLVSKFKP